MLNINQLIGFGVGADGGAVGPGDTYIMGGYYYDGAVSVANVTKISNTTFAHTAMTALGGGLHGGAGFGSNSVGYAARAASNYKRVYATDTASSATSYSGNYGQGWAAFNLTRSIISPNAGSTTEKYTYAGDSVASGTTLTYSNTDNYAGGTCCATYGYSTGNSGSDTTTTKYTFASDTVAAGSTMYQSSNGRDLMNSDTHGYRLDAGGTTYRKWNYAGESETSGTAAVSRTSYGGTGIGGNSTTGLTQAGFTTNYSVYDKVFKMVMATEVWSEITALSNPRFASHVTTSAAGAMA